MIVCVRVRGHTESRLHARAGPRATRMGDCNGQPLDTEAKSEDRGRTEGRAGRGGTE